MTEATKDTIKKIGIGLAIFVGYGVFVHVVPEGSIATKILAGVMLTALIGGIIFFTPLGNPLKKLYRKWKGIK